MRQRRPLSGVLVIMELGAEWPAWTETGVELTARGARRVLSQHEGETPEVFAERVARHLGSLFASKVELQRAVLACNERSDERAMQARTKLGQALTATLSGRRAWQLLFTASGRTGRIRHALSELATALSSAGGSSVQSARRGAAAISVRFGDETPILQQANVA